MPNFLHPFTLMSPAELDPQFSKELQRLYQLTLWGRWSATLAIWLTIGGLSFWTLRYNIQLWTEYLTWAAIKYAFIYHPWAAMGLATCLIWTASVLTWHCRTLFFGLSKPEQKRFEQRVLQIRRQGQSHPLWQWVCGK